MLRIVNVRVYTEDQRFVPGEVLLNGAVIGEVNLGSGGAGAFAAPPAHKNSPPEIKKREAADSECCLDGQGAYLIPGLTDLHFHGCGGDDVCDNTVEAFERIAAYEASVGVTQICPATMTLPARELEAVLRTAAQYRRECESAGHDDSRYADLVGLNMEGPFISPAKKGAQDAAHILPCSAELARRFLSASEGLVKILGLAPEESPDFAEYIGEMKDSVRISLAHTNADYATAKAAFDAGACHAVHLYNAMPPFAHRDPGVVGAVADSPHVMAEMICDGVHLHPATVRATFRMLGADRIIFISDSMRATGMPDGKYLLGGLEVSVKGKRASLVSDGALAGSVTNLADVLRTAVREMEIPLEKAIACATINPAKCLGIEDRYGSVTPGKKANLVLLGKDLELLGVIKDGKLLKESDSESD